MLLQDMLIGAVEGVKEIGNVAFTETRPKTGFAEEQEEALVGAHSGSARGKRSHKA
jgi:hypothetical protein